MSDGEGLIERRIARDDLLKLAAVAGGAGVLLGPGAVAEADGLFRVVMPTG